MRFCRHCKQSWDAAYEFCPLDGTRLVQDRRQRTAQPARVSEAGTAGGLAAAVDPEAAGRPSMHELEEKLSPEPSSAREMRRVALEMRQAAVRGVQGISEEERGAAEAPREARRDWKWMGGIGIALAAALSLYILFSGSGWDPWTVPADAGSEAQRPSPAPPKPSVTFSYAVLDRHGEGDPSHHPHTLMTLNGFNLFVLRAEAGHPSTVVRAQEAKARLRHILKMSGPDRAVRFSVAAQGEVRAHFEREEGGDQEMLVLALTQGDVVGNNRRSRHPLTLEELAVWYRNRLQAFWDTLARGEPPGVDSGLPEVVVLARFMQSAKAAAGREKIPFRKRFSGSFPGLPKKTGTSCRKASSAQRYSNNPTPSGRPLKAGCGLQQPQRTASRVRRQTCNSGYPPVARAPVDLRYAARLLARQPGFTAAACLVLASVCPSHAAWPPRAARPLIGLWSS